MRLLLLLLVLLYTAISAAISIGSAGEAGEDAAGAASKGATGEGAAGESGSNIGETSHDGTFGTDEDTGCTIYSCPNDDNNGGPATNPDVIPGSSSNDNGAGTDEDVDTAAEIIKHIDDVIDEISSPVSLAPSTSFDPSAIYTITRHTTLFPSAARPCLSAQSIYNSCDGDFENFTDQVVSQQASCLCYQQFGSGISSSSSGNDTNNSSATMMTWVPGLFDGYVSSCNGFIATQTDVTVSASVSLTGAGAGAGTSYTGICASVGDVRASPGSSGGSTKLAAASTTMTATSSSAAMGASRTVAPVTGAAARMVWDGKVQLMLLGMGMLVGLVGVG